MDPAISRLKALIHAHPGLILDDEAERAAFAAEAGDLDALAQTFDADATALAYCVYAQRKLGRFEVAERLAERALALERSFVTVTAAATVRRVQGDVDRACALFDEAAALDPADTSALGEGAKTLGEAGRFAEAEQWFLRAVARDPTDHEARMWSIFSGYAGAEPEAEAGYVARMEAFVVEHPDNPRAAFLLDQMTGG